MPKYVFHLEISAVRVDESGRDPKPGEDPILALTGAATKLMGGGPVQFGPPPGVSLRKTFPVSAESFAGLCEILGHFDDLAERIECGHP
jgi:hypothetical protein